MANWSRRRTKSFKGSGARSTTTITFGKGITRSSSTKLGNKRTTRSTAPNGKTKIIETYHANGATKRSVRTISPSSITKANTKNLFKWPKSKRSKSSGSYSGSSSVSYNNSSSNIDMNIFFWPIVAGLFLLSLIYFS